MKSRDIPCPLENDPDNFKLGKVSITLNVMVIFIIIIVKVAYIVAENKRRCEINLDLLAKFYIDLDIVTNHATDKLPSDAYVDPKLPYTQTGGLPTCLQLKKGVPVMLTVNSSTKRYKENGITFFLYYKGWTTKNALK